MSAKDDGGPAYQVTQWNNDTESYQIMGGMSMRDHFAGLAMQALLSPNHPWGGYPEKVIPRMAYEMADAMLAEKECGR